MVETLGELAFVLIAISVFNYTLACHNFIEVVWSLQLDGTSVLKFPINS